jgi:hypothetical protein
MTVQQTINMTMDDLKMLIAEVVATELKQYLRKSNTTVELESKDIANSVSNKLYVNSKGVFVLPKITPEEQMQRNQGLIALLDKWVEEGDPEEQQETYEYLQQAPRVSI